MLSKVKYIFLDVDGVINCDTTEETINGWCFVEDRLIQIVRYIMDNTCARVVLSSSWRSGYYGMRYGADESDESWGIAEYQALVERCGQNGVWFFSHTVWPESSNRGAEIQAWIEDQNESEQDVYHVTSFVILDDYDMDISRYFPDNFVKTNPAVGITIDDAEKAIEILGKEKRKHVYY